MSRRTRLVKPYARTQSGVQAIQPFLARLKRNQEDSTLLAVGDSTGNATDEWIYLLTQYLATQWPAYTVTYQLWDSVGLAYSTTTTVQTGTGANTLRVYNASVPGWTCLDPLVVLPDIAGAVRPDLTLISLGHNESDTSTYNGFRSLLHGRYVGLTESIAAMCPTSALVCVLQNPTTSNTTQALRASVYEQIAASRGYGIIDVHQTFIDAGIPAAWYLDSVHPNALGESYWAEVVQSYFAYGRNSSPLPRSASSFLQPADQMLVNGDFAFFSSATPDSWTNVGTTCSKDTTNKESPNGYAVRLQSAGASGANISQDLSAAQLAVLKGKYVTLAVRIRNNAGTQVSTHARAAIGVGGQASPVSLATPRGSAAGVFMWQVVTAFVPTGATYVRAIIYSDSSTTGTGDCSIDRVIMSRGVLPRDVTDPAALAARLSNTWTPPDTQEFTATGTWTKPATARVVTVYLIGFGGPGGSGRRDAAGTNRCGGGAGAGAAWSFMSFNAADLPSTVAVTFGAAGTPGAAVTTDTTNGNAGTTGGSVTFGTYLRAAGGGPGAGGTSSSGTAGQGGIGTTTGVAGGAASTTGGVGAAGGSSAAGGGAGGGGAGGGIPTSNVPSNGGAGSACPTVAAASGASGGVVDTSVPLAGNPSPARGVPGPGAGGGAASNTGPAQAGADATTYGGGAGGGGASLNGNNSGAGGRGGSGYALIVTSSGA